MHIKRVVFSLIAVGIAAAAWIASPSAATASADWCQQPYFWHDKNKHMATCIELAPNGLVTATTQTWSTNYWRGFHGCVAGFGRSQDGSVTYESPTHRFGVSAEHWREDTWQWDPDPRIDLSTITVRHWQCS